ncbi:cell wall-active antibiotics response protein LiaF [Brevibacillus dissolubilis]|uniref:cell wall-active antibiotics response protein LiaF n=1 Tax=Brevibacillus dissolubilis TaxID=1844116 RepID=UPI0021001858|nr:cell wall-active antibiotics response protein LiaF [Brevibacillus dissolubilis]
MISTRLRKMVLGIIIIFIGFGLFLDNIGFISFSLFDMWPLILIYIGARQWAKRKRLSGIVLISLGVLFVLDLWLGISVDDALGIAFPLVLMYYGLRLVRRKSKPLFGDKGKTVSSDMGMDEFEAWTANQGQTPPQNASDKTKASQRGAGMAEGWDLDDLLYRVKLETPFPTGTIHQKVESRSSLIGDFHLTSGRFELSHMQIWHGIGNVVIDLSRAVIPDEETFLFINGWIGDVTIYVPIDLPVSVIGEVNFGDMEILGHRQGGINRRVMLSADHYDVATQKVKIIISLIAGDIDVKYI